MWFNKDLNLGSSACKADAFNQAKLLNQNTRTRVSIDLLAIGIYRQHRKLILNIFTAAYTHLIFLFEESNIISRIWCPLDVSISFNELQCHYWFLYVLTAILDSNQCRWCCGPSPNHSDNGSCLYILAEAAGFEPAELFTVRQFSRLMY